jgi:hypothetical protein
MVILSAQKMCLIPEVYPARTSGRQVASVIPFFTLSNKAQHSQLVGWIWRLHHFGGTRVAPGQERKKQSGSAAWRTPPEIRRGKIRIPLVATLDPVMGSRVR